MITLNFISQFIKVEPKIMKKIAIKSGKGKLQMKKSLAKKKQQVEAKK